MTLILPETVQSPTGRRLDRLSRRELEVLRLIAQGLSNAAIARQLTVTLGAVEKNTQRIFAKLGLHPEDDDSHRRVLAVIQYLRSG